MSTMTLYSTPTSPFVRKVLVAAHELGVRDLLEPVLLRPVPTTPDPTLSATNPLSKIPTLVLPEGEGLFDSAVIVEYLESLADGRRVVPADGMERIRVLRTQALCDGILEAGVLVFYERTQRPEAHRWTAWIDGQTGKVNQALDVLEKECPSWDPAAAVPHLGQICAGAAIGWLELRGVVDPRAGRPALAAWYQRFATRPSMVATVPQA